jgi:hypothetical protein
MKPSEVILIIAQVAANFSRQAGTGGVETAGLIVSYLAANPDKAEDFMDHGFSMMIDDHAFRWENGALTWHGQNGEIVSPSELRKHLGQHD